MPFAPNAPPAAESITFAPVQLEHLDLLYTWENDPVLQELSSEEIKEHSLEEVRDELQKWIAGSDTGCVFGIYLDNRLIGYVQIAAIDRINRRCRMGILIGDSTQWGKGYGTRAFAFAVRHAFEVLGLHRVGAEAYGNNPRSMRMLEKVGFRREGVLRDNVFRGGRFWDEVVFGLLREEWVPMVQANANDDA